MRKLLISSSEKTFFLHKNIITLKNCDLNKINDYIEIVNLCTIKHLTLKDLNK